MPSPYTIPEVFSTGTAAGGSVTLSHPAAQVVRGVVLLGGATAISAVTMAAQTATSTSANVLTFTGTAEAPSSTVSFGSGVPANSILVIEYIPADRVPRDQ